MSSAEVVMKSTAKVGAAPEGPVVRTGPRGDFVVSDIAASEDAQQSLLDTHANPLDLTCFVSCYNESEYIVETLDCIRDVGRELGLLFEIIVIDDRSKDNSFEIVRDYIAAHPDVRITLLRNHVNKGLAQNYIEGAFIGRGRYYKLFCGDNTEPRDAVLEICRRIGEADMVVPYHIEARGKSRFRRWLSRTYTRIVNLVSGNRLNYYNGLAVHLRYNIMRWHPNTSGFGFQADIICTLRDQGATYVEVGVPNQHREGSSALSMGNLMSVGYTVLSILLRRIGRLGRRK